MDVWCSGEADAITTNLLCKFYGDLQANVLCIEDAYRVLIFHLPVSGVLGRASVGSVCPRFPLESRGLAPSSLAGIF